jgi:hypothetical protein
MIRATGMRMPSSKIEREPPAIEPGTTPPTSEWWPVFAANATSLPFPEHRRDQVDIRQVASIREVRIVADEDVAVAHVCRRHFRRNGFDAAGERAEVQRNLRALRDQAARHRRTAPPEQSLRSLMFVENDERTSVLFMSSVMESSRLLNTSIAIGSSTPVRLAVAGSCRVLCAAVETDDEIAERIDARDRDPARAPVVELISSTTAGPFSSASAASRVRLVHRLSPASQ